MTGQSDPQGSQNRRCLVLWALALALLPLFISACVRVGAVAVPPTPAFLSPLAAQPSPPPRAGGAVTSPLPTMLSPLVQPSPPSPYPFAPYSTPAPTPIPTPTPTVGPSPTPPGHWFVPVVAADESVWSMVSPPTASPTPMYAWPPWRGPGLTSPNGTYAITCDDRLRLYRVADVQLLSESPVQLLLPSRLGCFSEIFWAPNESAVAFWGRSDTEQQVSLYIWPTNSSSPRKALDNVHAYGPVAWSPDACRLAVIRDLSEDGKQEIVAIVDVQGRLLSEFRMERGGQVLTLGWLTDDVLVKSMFHAGLAYYRVSTGRYLFTWVNVPEAGLPLHQPPLLSPNRRWVTLDQSDYLYFPDQDEYNQGYRVQKRYTLFDLRTDTESVLANNRDTFLRFLGWSEDSSTLYVISRPAISTSVAAPETPYGLLAFHPVSRQFRLLFKDAIWAEWGPDKSWAYVVFTSPGANGALGLAGGFWKVGSETVIGQQPVSDEMIYQDPAYDPMYASKMFAIPLAWSHNGKHAVIAGPSGQVNLFSTESTLHPLVTDLPCPSWRAIRLGWSGDDRYVLVQCGSRVWLADVGAH